MKSHASSSAKLPLWIFFVSDAALLGAAAFLATRAARPLNGETVFLITALVLAGALVALVPLVARYERIKNETLDDRQRALETLARSHLDRPTSVGGLERMVEPQPLAP